MDVQAVPLEKKLITVVNLVTAKEEKLPALHLNHVRDINFLEYALPSFKDEEVDDEWLESLQIINDDLYWLLSQSHWLFWSQVVHDMSLQKFLDSYLRLASRPHDQLNFKYQDIHRRLIEEVNRRVFMVFLRLSTHKESKEHFISPNVFGDILYQYFLFDIPKIFDLCAIYGQENSALLGKMISNIFTNQPGYSLDLMASVNSTYELLDQFVTKICNGKSSDVAQTLDSAQLAPDELADWILFVADIFNTLHIFLLVHPPSCSVFQKTNFAQRVAGYYDSIIPVLQDKWHLLKDILNQNPLCLKLKLRATKKNMAAIVYQLLTQCFVNADTSPDDEDTTTPRNGKPHEKLWEDFLSAVTVLITEKSFLKEFEKHYSIEQLISSMKKHHSSFDEANFAYIIEAVQVKKPAIASEVKSSIATLHDPVPMLACSNSSDTTSEDIQSVKELFPHLETCHIEKLITSYHGNTSAVIDAILEGKTDIGTHSNASTEKHIVKEHSNDATTVVAHADRELLLGARSNFYDHDEFDVFHHDNIDLSRVHIGKKFDFDKVSHVLDDKSEIDALKNRITLDNFDLYEDEYDDTYDTHNVGAADADSADEMLPVKRLNEKGLFGSHFQNEADSNEEDQENITENNNHKTAASVPTDSSSHNRSSQNQPKWSKGPHHQKGSRDQFKKSSHMTDRSAPNDNSSQRGRAMKARHKGSHANHNRKDRAQQKMQKGMF